MTSHLPNTYKAIVVPDTAQQLSIKEIPLEKPKAGEILVKVEACGVCHSDHSIAAGHWGPIAFKDLILGHEIVGRVVAIGAGEKKWHEGDRVGGAWHGGHDNACKSCQRGLFQMCANELVNGFTRNGGYAEYCTLRTEAAVRIPEDADAAETAPLLCAGVTVFNGIRQMKVTPGATVAIQGLGGLGHLALQYARKMGYRTVALSRDAKKRDFAFDLGATDYIDCGQNDVAEELQKLGGADLIVMTAPDNSIMGKLVNGLAPGGKLLALSGAGDITVPSVPMILGGRSVHGWPSGHALDSEEAIAFANLHGVKCKVETFPMSQAQQAMEKMVASAVRFRAVLKMD